MQTVRTLRLLPLLAMLLLPACVTAPLSVSTQPTGCGALIPRAWKSPVPAPAFEGSGDTVADWQVYADAVTGKLDVANDRTVSTIEIVENCEARDALAVKRGRRGFFSRLIGG